MMFSRVSHFIISGSLCLWSALSLAQNLPTPVANPVPAPTLAANAWLLVDFQSGQVLAQEKPDERIAPASLTKLMTAYLSFTALREGRLKLTQTLPISEKAWKAEGSRMFLQPNQPARVEELIRGMIVQSGNDACITLAEAIAGSEESFAALMNQQAQKLGMKNTHFMNATGLPNPQHYTTARDLSLLASAIVRDFPEFYPIYSMKEYRYNNITQPNRNRLLTMDPSVDGLKTGHTDAAGYCLIASAKREQRRVLSVVLGTASDLARATESQKLINYGMQFFETPKLHAKEQAVAQLPVWKGEKNQLKVGFTTDRYITLPHGQAAKITRQLVPNQPLVAPIQRGQAVGVMKMQLDGKPFADYPVLALETIPAGGIFTRLWDGARLWFNK